MPQHLRIYEGSSDRREFDARRPRRARRVTAISIAQDIHRRRD